MGKRSGLLFRAYEKSHTMLSCAPNIDTFVKLAEGGFNQTFLNTMHDGFEMEARIPYPVTVPKFYAIASEVATMRFLFPPFLWAACS